MKWSDNQLKAIEGRGSDIIVSAAAGSGKTAVLIERLKSLITDDGVNLNEVLVATFTNAAAQELKERLAKALSVEVERACDIDRKRFLVAERKKIEHALIGTFHSFAIDLLREFHYRVGISKNFSVLSQQSDELITREALDAVFNEFFEARDEKFFAFLDVYSSDKSDDAIKENIIDVYTKLRALPYYDEILDREVAVFKRAVLDFNNLSSLYEFRELIKKMFSDAKEHFGLLLGRLDDAGCTSLKEKFHKVISYVNEPNIDFMTADINDIRRYAKILLDEFPAMRVSKDEKESYEVVKDECKKLTNKIKGLLKGDLLESILSVPLDREPRLMKKAEAHIVMFSKIIKNMDRIGFELKQEYNAYSFSDLEHLALKVLCMDDVARIYKDRIKHIFVDEYQDSNEMQEEILSKFTDDNLFLVGDVKQSIYRFRFAEPSLFEGRYDAYLGTSSLGSVVDLKENYRSKQAVIDAVNVLFKNVIPKYDERHRLVAGRKEQDFIGEVKVCEAEFDKEISNNEELKSKDKYRNYLKLIDTLGKDFYEGLLIGSEIKAAVGREYFDAKEGLQKKLKYSDIAVLFRSIKGRGKKIRLALELLGIPVNMQASGDILDFKEVNLLHCILKLADNFYDDLSLVTVLLSPVYGFSPQDTAEIRIWGDENGYRGQPFYACFLAFSKNLCKDSDACENDDACENVATLRIMDRELLARVNYFVDDILRFRRYGYTLSLHMLIKRICEESGAYELAKLSRGNNSGTNLDRYIDFANEFEKERGNATLSELLQYIDSMYKNGLVIEQDDGEEGENIDAVNVMTIHRSKGLEFPLVIVAGCTSSFLKNNVTPFVDFDKKHGMFMRYIDEESGDMFISHREILHKYSERDAEYDEAMRIFYVACTRAKDFLLFSAVTDGKKRSVHTYSSFYDVICENLACDDNSCKNKWFRHEEFKGEELLKRTLDSEDVDKHSRQTHESRPYLSQVPAEESDFNNLKAGACEKEFISVTEFLKMADREVLTNNTIVKPGIDEDNDVFSHSDGNGDVENGSEVYGIDPARIGTAVHRLFERLSFEGMVSAGEAEMIALMSDEIKSIKNEYFLNDDEISYIKDKKLPEVAAFFKDEFMRDIIKNAKSIEKEKSFIMKDDKMQGRIIEGVIDCFFEGADEITVIDYKTNEIGRSDKRIRDLMEYYRPQLELYKRACERGYNKPVSAYVYFTNAQKFCKV